MNRRGLIRLGSSSSSSQHRAKQAAERQKRGNWQSMELSGLLEVESKSPDSKPTWVESTGQPLRSSDFMDTQFMKVRDEMEKDCLFFKAYLFGVALSLVFYFGYFSSL